ncbi:molecular chaperone HtpG [bacterium]|nr:molecular chaperone HtpG [candidate division CSSED10-310 bacterium]
MPKKTNPEKSSDRVENGVEIHTFQAEVANVLDIVINSLYTDREIFIRELVSNAADALEKIRHLALTDTSRTVADLPLKIEIDLDEANRLFTITDTGIGMTREELIENLGSIAHSGSIEFMKQLAENIKQDINLIGQFGVGFYSAFMVADKIRVKTRSFRPDSQGYEWSSTGSGGYSIVPRDGLSRGTTVILELKSDATEYASSYRIRRAINKYSNFVPFPILVNKEKINTVEAIWTRNRNEIKKQEYVEFYKFISAVQEEPLDWLHFSTDAPLSLNALLFIPGENLERFGFGKLDLNVDLHCRKVLIERHAREILPAWLRFLHGIVDSEDIPLNISRETMQDSALVRKINRALTSKFIKHLDEMIRDDPKQYGIFWKTFGGFIKEGIVTDPDHREALSRLLRFETSKTAPGETISLDQYVERMPDTQKEIYFITGFDRKSIDSGPYMEVFRTRDIEIIYNFDPVDDFVMTHLASYRDKNIISAESEKLDLPPVPTGTDEPGRERAGREDLKQMGDWFRKVLQDKILDARPSGRLSGSPLILLNPEGRITGAMQQLLHSLNHDKVPAMKRTLEFDPDHSTIQKLFKMKDSDPEFAQTVLEQLYDHAAMSAGLPVDTREMIKRMDSILSRSLTMKKPSSTGSRRKKSAK